MKKTILIFLAGLMALASCQKNNENGPEPEPETETPDIQLAISGNIILTSWAGLDTIAYTVTNPAEDGKLTATASETWIDGFGYDISNAVTFSYQENASGESRSSIITLEYTYGENLSVEKQINVIQNGAIFSITVEDVKPTSARMISSCGSADIYWTSDVFTKERIDNIGGKDNMPEYFADMLMNETWMQYGYESFESFIKMYLFEGGYVDDWVYTGLAQTTEYVTFAVGMDYEGNYTTEFFWGPEFTTGAVVIDEDLTFDIKVEPKSVTANLSVTPSDANAYYIATTVEKSIYSDGYTDEDIMTSICANYGEYIIYYVQNGSIENYTVSNMKPSTEYYAIAFGVDLDAYVFNSHISKEAFTTTDNGSSYYASADVEYYWDINDLVEYNPDYEAYRNKRPLMAAFGFEFSNTTESAYYIVWYGDVTGERYEDVYSNTINAGPQFIEKGDPSPIIYMDYNEPSTMCVIAVDGEGNYGDMSMTLITLTEEGKSTDYALFDEYFNAIMGGAAPAGIPAPAEYKKQPSQTVTMEAFTASMMTGTGNRNKRI